MVDPIKEQEKLKQMYTDIFSSESGKKVLQDLEKRCNYHWTSYVAGDANATTFEEGKRATILHIHQMIIKET